MDIVEVELAKACPSPKTFVQTLEERIEDNGEIIKPNEGGQNTMSRMVAIAKAQIGVKSDAESAEEWSRRDLDSAQTRTQEREQQMEQEKQKQREVERESNPWRATDRDLDDPVLWNLPLRRNALPKEFYNFNKFRLYGTEQLDSNGGGGGRRGGKKRGSQKVQLPNVADDAKVLLSQNFASSEFAGARARRLKSLFAVAHWPGDDTTVALTLLETATLRRAMAEAGGRTDYRLLLRNGKLIAGAGVKLSQRQNRATSQLQLLRYFDCRTSFSEKEVGLLLYLLAKEKPEVRQYFFTSMVMCRRRDESKWIGRSIQPALQVKNYSDFTKVVDLKAKIVAVLSSKSMSPVELCKVVDTNNDQAVSLGERRSLSLPLRLG